MTFIMQSLAQNVTGEQTASLQMLDVVDDRGYVYIASSISPL